MLQITLNLDTEKATVATGAVIIVGKSVPATINCVRASGPSSPGDSPVFEIALGTDATPAVQLAYLGAFDAQSETAFTGYLNANDTRLVAFMAAKGATTVKVELQWTVDGRTQGAPHFTASVEPSFISPGDAEEGGPVYLTQAQMDARYALIGVTRIPDRSAANALRLVVINTDGNLAYEI